PYVFIVGMEEGLCPHSRSIDDPSQMEEERRLVYVGITRAMKGLFLVYATRRMLYGNAMMNQLSRFLVDIPPELSQTPFGRTKRSAPAAQPAAGPLARPTPPGQPVQPAATATAPAATAEQQ